MIQENFATFVTFFKEAGRDINAQNQYGETLLQTIKTHRQASKYVEILKQADAE